jgi:hypothetical protein
MSQDQNAALLDALKEGPMTAMDALNRLGIARASARVFDLREQGHDIRSQDIAVTNRHGKSCRVALYSLGEAQRTLLPVHPGRGVMHP